MFIYYRITYEELQEKTTSLRLERRKGDPNSPVIPFHHEVFHLLLRNLLNCAREIGVKGFEPSKPLASDLQSEVTLQRYRTPVNLFNLNY